ncbi:hypothetical protein AALA13_03365 [Lachnospiraceae bacterium 50-23]|jgi:energy-coupling factor transporter ATP-binding protein EcfA2|nr:AAA family ATPase [Dorea sp.]
MTVYSVTDWIGKRKNFMFVGESGCGKSETALHFAFALAGQKTKTVHFFDMDQTKPLFRSRDVRQALTEAGVVCHATAQVLDTPNLVSGAGHFLCDEDSYVIVDVGGNGAGARLIGGLAPYFSRQDTSIGYLINPYRPWSQDVYSIDSIMTEIRRAARIPSVHVIASPNLGRTTSASEFLEGCDRLIRMVGEYVEVEFAVVMEALYESVKEASPFLLLPIRLRMKYPWDDEGIRVPVP